MANKKKVKKQEAKKAEESKYQRISAGKSINDKERESAFDFLFDGAKKDESVTFEDKEEIVFIPTILPSFNRASIIGGWPLGTIGEIKGPNAGGKTAVGIQILKSFVDAGHIGIFIDAERAASDKKWIGDGLQLDLRKCGYYVPESLEDASEYITEKINKFKEGKKKGKIGENVALCILVDSATMLVPEEQVKKGVKGKDIGLQARLFSVWMKVLMTQVGVKGNEKPSITVIFLNQERRNVGAKPWEPQWYSTCGEALQFAASVRMRVVNAGKVKEGDKIVGKKHRITVEKNKVGYPDSVGYFYISRGGGVVPVGIDYGREIIEECCEAGIIDNSSKGWYQCELWEGKKREKDVLQLLLDNKEILEQLRQMHLDKVLNGELSNSISTTILDEFDDEDEEGSE